MLWRSHPLQQKAATPSARRRAAAALYRRAVPASATDEDFLPSTAADSPSSGAQAAPQREVELASLSQQAFEEAHKKQQRRLARLRAPESVSALTDSRAGGYSSFDDVADAVAEWRTVVVAAANGDVGASSKWHRNNQAATTAGVRRLEVPTRLGLMRFRVQANSERIAAAFGTQLPSLHQADHAGPAAKQRVVVDASVFAMAGDVRRPAQAGAVALDDPSPVEEGTSASDASSLGMPHASSGNDATMPEFGTLAHGTGSAYQCVRETGAALKLHLHSHVDGVGRGSGVANSSRFGSVNRDAGDFIRESSAERIGADTSRYTKQDRLRTPLGPISCLDADMRRVALIGEDTRSVVRRDVLRQAIATNVVGSLAPLLRASLISCSVVSSPTSGDSVLLVGPKGSGKTTLAMHAIAAAIDKAPASPACAFCCDGPAMLCRVAEARKGGLLPVAPTGSASRAGRLLGGQSTGKQPLHTIPAVVSDDDCLIVGLPLDPLVGVGAATAAVAGNSTGYASDALAKFFATAPRVDACDAAWWHRECAGFAAIPGPADRWVAQRTLRLDLQAAFGASSVDGRTAFAGRVSHVVFTNWEWPGRSTARRNGTIAVPVAAASAVRAGNNDPCSGGGMAEVRELDLVASTADADWVLEAARRHVPIALNPQLRPLRDAAFSAPDVADILLDIKAADPTGEASPHVLHDAYQRGVAAAMLRRFTAAGVPTYELGGQVDFAAGARFVNGLLNGN